MEREMAGVFSFGAAPATKKHVDKSVVFVADGKTKSHTRTHECHTEKSLNTCVCKEGLQGTERQEEVMVMTVLPYRRTVNDGACSTTPLHLRMLLGKRTAKGSEPHTNLLATTGHAKSDRDDHAFNPRDAAM